MYIHIYITRTNVIFLTTLVGHVQIVYITEANDHISEPGESNACGEDQSLLLLRS